MMEPRRHPLRNRFLFRRQNTKRTVDTLRRTMQNRVEHDVAARYGVLGDAFAREIERTAFARTSALCRLVLCVYRPYTGFQAGRANGDMIPDGNRTGQNSAGYDRTNA